jgi:hypothetical protein
MGGQNDQFNQFGYPMQFQQYPQPPYFANPQMMMPPQFDMQPPPQHTQMTFTTPEGNSLIDIEIFDTSPEVSNHISQARELINKQQNQEAWDLLSKLMEEKKINLI